MFAQVLLMQVAIAAGVAVLATGLFLAPLSDQLDDQAMRRALSIAQTTAAQPQIAEDLAHTPATVGGPVQREDLLDGEIVPTTVGRLLMERGYRSLLSVPILRDDQVLGAVTVGRTVPGPFPSEVVALLQTFATQSALAIDNARWFARLRTVGADEERTRIARDLHDRLGQTLALAKINLGELRESLPVEHVSLTDKIRDLLDQTIKDTRSLVLDICPQVLYQFGLETAMDWLVEQVQAKYGLRCVVEKTRPLKPLKDNIQIVLFQAVRELLLNVAKHARATEARIILEGGQDSVKIQVVDDGCEMGAFRQIFSNGKSAAI